MNACEWFYLYRFEIRKIKYFFKFITNVCESNQILSEFYIAMKQTFTIFFCAFVRSITHHHAPYSKHVPLKIFIFSHRFCIEEGHHHLFTGPHRMFLFLSSSLNIIYLNILMLIQLAMFHLLTDTYIFVLHSIRSTMLYRPRLHRYL